MSTIVNAVTDVIVSAPAEVIEKKTGIPAAVTKEAAREVARVLVKHPKLGKAAKKAGKIGKKLFKAVAVAAK